MTQSELFEILANGENSFIEFKRDDVKPQDLAKECVAFANTAGGRILLGVEDNGEISGTSRGAGETERWVMDTVFGKYIHPTIIPLYEELAMADGKRIGVITIASGISKPYYRLLNEREEPYIRIGTLSKLATREQQLRLLESSGLLYVEKLPISGTSMRDLDARRFKDFTKRFYDEQIDSISNEELAERMLMLDILHKTETSQLHTTIVGLLLFGNRPARYLPQAGVRIIVYRGEEPDYDTMSDEVLDAPLVELRREGENDEQTPNIMEKDFFSIIVERLQPFISHERVAEGAITRERVWDYPPIVLREALVNAFAHRDWTKANQNRIEVFSNRMEITSFGGLPNTLTIEKIKRGQQYPRNPLLIRALRYYGYIDDRGMGIRRKIIPEMLKYSAQEPIFEITEDFVKLILLKRISSPFT
ncbi:MAG: putative DNA binding domain-containing protein [Candidatus Kapabacteria bacterium]|jgi:ATP-dependent DNA helicase RecG|nr:putative DNA binding domain-containing protein [Candidatus Kapabacteria bacterium]